jgi:DNA-binding HxlR family transcriptional regulator
MSPTGRASRKADRFTQYRGSGVVIALLADKWTIPVIHTLARGMLRTGELKRQLGRVSQKMLTQTLRRLEEHGVVERTVHPVVPPRVEYRLTALGISLNEPLARLCEWTEKNGAALERAAKRRVDAVGGAD